MLFRSPDEGAGSLVFALAATGPSLAALVMWLLHRERRRVVRWSLAWPVAAVVLGALPPLDAERQTLLFRVAQEGLSNVVRHSGAKNAVLAIAARAPGVWLTVWDDGGSLPAADDARRRDGSGLASMRERVAAFGGHLHLESAPATGTWLRVTLPLDDRDPGPAR